MANVSDPSVESKVERDDSFEAEFYGHRMRALCGLWVVVDYGATLASVYALVAICVDRLWATKWCHHYRKYNTRKKVAVMCVLVWYAHTVYTVLQ